MTIILNIKHSRIRVIRLITISFLLAYCNMHIFLCGNEIKFSYRLTLGVNFVYRLGIILYMYTVILLKLSCVLLYVPINNFHFTKIVFPMIIGIKRLSTRVN